MGGTDCWGEVAEVGFCGVGAGGGGGEGGEGEEGGSEEGGTHGGREEGRASESLRQAVHTANGVSRAKRRGLAWSS